MAVFKWTLGLLSLIVVSTWAKEESVSERIGKANSNIAGSPAGLYVEDDIAYDSEAERNADPCTAQDCKWEKASDGLVYVPFIIANHYTSNERAIIDQGLQSFHSVSCIRFVPRTNQRDYIHIQSLGGCYSFVGRRFNGQNLSLDRQGCLHHNVVQHELLHALGFHHEQSRSDRDQHIRILLENVTPGYEFAFDKVDTLNQGTPYDYNSVMHYDRYAFSKNNQPTMEAVPNPNTEFGKATQMSQNDITRLNRLYKCK